MIGGNQASAMDERRCCDDAIRGILRIALRKPHGPDANCAGNRQNDKSGLDLCQEVFKAGVQL